MASVRCALCVAALVLGTLIPSAGEAGEKAGPVKGSREKQGFTYYEAGRRDPFVPLRTGPRECRQMGLASVEQLKLTGVVWDGRQYRALIELPNGQGYVVRTGDVICEDTRVIRIAPDGMTLEIEPGAATPREKKQERYLTIQLRRN